MDILLLGLIAVAALTDDNSKSKKKRKSYRRNVKKYDSWLDAAWFHDHNQKL